MPLAVTRYSINTESREDDAGGCTSGDTFHSGIGMVNGYSTVPITHMNHSCGHFHAVEFREKLRKFPTFPWNIHQSISANKLRHTVKWRNWFRANSFILSNLGPSECATLQRKNATDGSNQRRTASPALELFPHSGHETHCTRCSTRDLRP